MTPVELLNEAIAVGCDVDIIDNKELLVRGPPRWIKTHRAALLKHRMELTVIAKARAARTVEYGKILPFKRP